MDSKITQLQQADEVRLQDLLPMVQVSNTTQSPQGSTVYANINQLLTLFQTLLAQDVQNYYNTIPAMFAGQASQTSGRFQFVTDATADPSVSRGYAYYEYLGTVNGDLTDYRKLSNSELNLNDKLDKGGYVGTAADIVAMIGEGGEGGGSGAGGKDGLISGASEHIGDYQYRFIATSYRINGILYSSVLNTVITFDAAHATNDRIDLVVIEVIGGVPTIAVIKGEPNTPASKPLLDDIETQIEFTFITVRAGTTEPDNITNILVYDEYVQQPGGEWSATTLSLDVFLDDETDPFEGTKAILFDNVTGSNDVWFTSPTVIEAANTDLLFKIKLRTASGQVSGVYVSIGGNPVLVRQGTYGFDSNNTASYQSIIIPLSDFSETSFNTIKMSSRTSRSDFFIDKVVLQTGNYILTTGDFLPTGGYVGTAADIVAMIGEGGGSGAGGSSSFPSKAGVYNVSQSLLPFNASNGAITDNYIYAGIGENFVKWNIETGVEILLTVPGATDWRSVFKHSSGKIFFSPMKSYAGGESMSSSDSSLYSIDPSDDSITKALQLSSNQSIWGIDEDSNGNIFAGVYSFIRSARIFRSTDGGQTFSIVLTPDSGGANNHTHVVFVDKSNNYIYVLSGDDYGGDINYRSTDGGDNWSLILEDEPVNQFTAGISVDGARLFGTDQKPYGRIYRSTDDVSLTLVLDTHYQNFFFFRKSDVTGWIYAGAKLDAEPTEFIAQIYISKDLGLTWQLYFEIENLSASDGFWFASQFHKGKMMISFMSDSVFKNSIIIRETVSEVKRLSTVASYSRLLTEFDNNRIIQTEGDLFLTFPSFGLQENFMVDLDCISGSVTIHDSFNDSEINFRKGNRLAEGKFGKIFRQQNGRYTGVLGFGLSDVDFNQNLIASYDLSVDSLDAVNGYNGINTDIEHSEGKAEFNGLSSNIIIRDADNFSFTDGVNDLPFTVEFWITFYSNNTQFIINKQSSANMQEYVLAYAGGSMMIYLNNISVAGQYIRINHGFEPVFGKEYHFVYTYDGSKSENGLNIYKNGIITTVSRQKKGAYIGMSNGASDIGFGYNHRNIGEHLYGGLSRVRFWKNREMRSIEVMELYNNGKGLRYPF